MGTIRIKDLLIRSNIGFSEHEKGKKQDAVLNILIKYNSTKAEGSDEPTDALDYKTITKQIIDKVENTTFNLLEAQVRMVLNLIMEFQEVKFASVEIDKPHALRYSESVSFSLSEKRD